MRRYFQVSVHALIIAAFIALATTGRLDVPSIAVFTLGWAGSLYYTIRNSATPLSVRAGFILSCLYIGVFALDSLALSRSFITATIHLVLFLELVKLYQYKTDKDYFYLIILAFLKILAASSLTIGMSFVITFIFFLIALVSTLMSFEMCRSDRQSAAQAAVIARPLGSMSVWATAWILFTGAVLFFLIPRVGGGYFSPANTQSVLLSGFSENVRLGQIGEVKLSSSVVMRTRLITGRPYDVLKWRGISLDAFDGKNWSKTDRSHTRLPLTRGEFTLPPAEEKGAPVRYEVQLEPLATTALFGPHRVRSIRGAFPGLDSDRDGAVYTRIPVIRRIQYEVTSDVPLRPAALVREPAARESAKEPSIPGEILAHYLQLPQTMDPRIRVLASEITSRANTALEKAAAIETYLKKNYRYSLRLTWDPGEQPISTFLFNTKSGHCEYFASSMAILLRAVEVPTRLVNGFLMGEYNPVAEDYIVRQSDAHSWIEVYIPGTGWIEFDPTPPDPNERDRGMTAQLSYYLDAAELYWNSYILIYDSGLQSQLFRSVQEKVQALETDLQGTLQQWLGQGQGVAEGAAYRIQYLFDRTWFRLLVLFGLVAGFAIRYRKSIGIWIKIWRVRHGAAVTDETVIEEMFYRATRLVERHEQRRRASETWREWIESLSDAKRRSVLVNALGIFERSKYGRLPVSASDFMMLEEAIREMKA